MKSKLLKLTSAFLIVAILLPQAASAFVSANVVLADEQLSLDVTAFEAEFSELEQLESAVFAGEITSLDEVEIAGMNTNKNYGIAATTGDLEFDWPAALWGFLCCPVGFFIYVTNKNRTKDEKTSFWIGFAAGTVLNAIIAAGGGYNYEFE